MWRWVRAWLTPGKDHGPAGHPAEPVTPALSEVDLSVASRVSDLFTFTPEDLPLLFSLPALRTFRIAIGQVLALASAGEPLRRGRLVQEAERARLLHDRAMRRLLDTHEALERVVRELAWALEAARGLPLSWSVVPAAAVDRFARGLEEDQGHHDPPRVIWWLCDEPAPPSLLALARKGRITLVASRRSLGDTPCDAGTLAAENAALIERAGRRITISTAAAWVGAAAARIQPRRVWRAVPLPCGFVALDREVGMDEALAARFRHAIWLLSGGGEAELLVVASELTPKSATPSVSLGVRAAARSGDPEENDR